jgi:hypothetical protein
MASLRKNIAGQHIGFVLTNSTNGAPVTAGGAGTIVIDGGAQAACTGTFTHKGTGQWDYAPTQAETNGTSISFAFTGTSAIQIGMLFYTDNWDTSQAVLTSGGGANQITVSGAGAVSNVTTVGSVTGNVGGNVTGSVGSVVGNVGGSVASVTNPVTITSNIKQNVAVNGFTFTMTDATTHAPKTGLTITSQVSINGGAFGATTNTASEIAFGDYQINLAAGDVNGKVIMLRFTSAGADDLNILIITQP